MRENRTEGPGGSRADEPLVTIGRIQREWGIKGEFLVIPMTFDPERFLSLPEAFVGEDVSVCRKFTGARFHKNLILMGIEGCRTPEEARLLRGSLIRIKSSESPELPEGTYYQHQIIGLMVYTSDGRCLGKVESIIETRSNDVYVVRGEEGEILIPAIRDVVREIDLESGRIVVDPLDMLEE
ncbi:MAG: ribosome maturation factor RimM [Thermodesulfovibrionales bacterium]|jgi:16S rRNA processing protein RimM